MQRPDNTPIWVPVALKVAAAGLAFLSIGPQMVVCLQPASRDFVIANEPRMPWPDRQ